MENEPNEQEYYTANDGASEDDSDMDDFESLVHLQRKLSKINLGGQDQDKYVEAKKPSPSGPVGVDSELVVLDDDDDSTDEEGKGSASEVNAPAAKLIDDVEGEEGQGWMAVKPYIGALKEPTNAPANNPRLPKQTLEVEWVYGYRGHDSRDNLSLDKRGRVIYPMAGFVLALDYENGAQEQFQGHTDDVLCLCKHPLNSDIVATGQVATISMSGKSQHPHICVTNVSTGDIIRLPSLHRRAVRCVAFSPDGKYLASVGADGSNTIIVWDWSRRRMIAEAKGDTNTIYCIEWMPLKTKAKGGYQFSTTGKRHVFFWTFTPPSGAGKKGGLKKKRAKSGKYGIKTFFCHKYVGSPTGSMPRMVAGTRDGSILLFDIEKGSAIRAALKVHKGPIFAISPLPTGGIATGGKDGYVRFLDNRWKEKATKVKFPGKVRSLLPVEKENSASRGYPALIVGTSHGRVYELPINMSTTPSKPRVLISGHFEGEVWGLDVTDGPEFYTCGEDDEIIQWSLAHQAHLPVKVMPLGEAAPADARKGKTTTRSPRRLLGASTLSRMPSFRCGRAVVLSKQLGHIAIGRNDGCVVVMDAKTFKPLMKQPINLNSYSKAHRRQRKGQAQKISWIEAMQYSPCSSLLAVGTHGMVVCLLDTTSSYQVVSTLKSSNSSITSLDWSSDSRQLRTNDRAYELLFYNIDLENPSKSKQNPHATSLRDVSWASNTCALSWGTQGVWDSDMDGTDVNAVDVCQALGLVVSGDDHGNVNLMRYPVLETENSKHRFSGHSSHVTRVRFTPCGTRVLSVGGNDKSVVQWKVLGAGPIPEFKSPAKSPGNIKTVTKSRTANVNQQQQQQQQGEVAKSLDLSSASESWDEKQTMEWLKSVNETKGLRINAMTLEAIEEQELMGIDLKETTEQDLISYGITKGGQRKRVMRAIKLLG